VLEKLFLTGKFKLFGNVLSLAVNKFNWFEFIAPPESASDASSSLDSSPNVLALLDSLLPTSDVSSGDSSNKIRILRFKKSNKLVFLIDFIF
tara:strand:- start:139 stop:414 length:276 start_codon:yes stop_codon:yes gene_type:complete